MCSCSFCVQVGSITIFPCLINGIFVYVFISSNMLHLSQNIKFPLDYQCRELVVCQ